MDFSKNKQNESDEFFFESSMPPKTRFEVYFLVAICVIGFAGNAIVLVVYSGRKYRRSNAGLYVRNLAIGDTMALMVVMFHVTEFFRVSWPILWRSDLQCAIHRYFRFVGFNLTVFTMVAISIDRYFAVCHPLTFRIKLTASRTKVIIALLWVMSLAAASPTAFWFKAIYGSDDTGITYKGKTPFACKLVLPGGQWMRDFKGIYLNVFLCFAPTLVTAITYVIIVVHVWKAGKLVGQRGSKHCKGGGVESSHWKAARTLLIVFLAYVTSYIFFATYNIVSQYGDSIKVPSIIKNIGLLLPYANSCMNPFIYSIMHKSFRKACMTLIRMPFTHQIPARDTEIESIATVDSVKERNERGTPLQTHDPQGHFINKGNVYINRAYDPNLFSC